MTGDPAIERGTALLREWTCAAAGSLPAVERIDAHTHLGLDIDGMQISLDELLEQMDEAAVDHAFTTPLAHDDGYDAANREVLAWCAETERLDAMWRIDPKLDSAARDAESGFDAGAVGLKLHPRAEQFAMSEPGVAAAAAVADERGAFILIHAGRGIPNLGEHTIALAERFPGATFVLAHAAVSDLSWIVLASEGLPNLVFDSSWWVPLDLAALFASADPARVVFGSDPPYGTVQLGVVLAARAARSAGYGEAELAALFGGTAKRQLLGRGAGAGLPTNLQPAGALEPARGPGGFRASEDWAFRRAATYLVGGLMGTFTGGQPDEAFAMADNALELPAGHPAAEEAQRLRAAIRLSLDWFHATPAEQWTVAAHPAIMTLMHVHTAELGVPWPPGWE